MEEYNDNVETNINIQINASEWAGNETDKLLKKYRACKTEHAKNRLIPQLEYMRKRMAFEQRALAKLIGQDEYGNEIE